MRALDTGAFPLLTTWREEVNRHVQSLEDKPLDRIGVATNNSPICAATR